MTDLPIGTAKRWRTGHRLRQQAPVNKVAGALFSQIPPSYDERVVASTVRSRVSCAEWTPQSLPMVSSYSLRLASYRNHERCSASSIQTSSRLALATSPCSSHNACVSRMRAASSLLSSCSSPSMSWAVT